jgi:Prokaryotic E2 family E/Multiubiquitin
MSPTHRIQIADAELNERSIDLHHDIPNGRQILEAANLPVDNCSLFVILPNGDFEDVRLAEAFDLRARGVERFIAFHTDRIFKITIDNRQVAWGEAHILGAILKKLAGVPDQTYDVYQDVRGGHDLLIRDNDCVNLAKPGTEHFVTVIRHTTEGLSRLPSRDRSYLEQRDIAVDVLTEGGYTAVVLKTVVLPVGKFDSTTTDILILLPPGYPDIAPDMFYCDPWLKLTSVGRYPNAADVPHVFAGRNWQRWSRHNNAWRPGIDGLHTMIKRVELALVEAK